MIATVNTAGALISNQRFDAWGNKGTTNGTTPTYGFTGREPDATGLTFYRARYYHPGIARFASRDPMGMVDAVSPYAYVGNNPINLIDPSGLFALTPEELQTMISGGSYFGLGSGRNSTDGISEYPLLAAAGLPQKPTELMLFEAGGGGGGGGGGKTFQTYTRTNPTTNEVYSGRTSGDGKPQQNVDKRNASSPLNDQGFNDAVLDRSSSNASSIRGREQQLIEQFGGAQSQGGASANKINGISPSNPSRQNYLDNALQEFGKLLGL